jgi:GGDEF domain-containing protein
VDFSSTGFPLAIVSTDTAALREITWTLSAYGYSSLPSSDWSDQAPWRRMYTPGLLILDARDEEEINAALAASRSNPFVYRVALYDASLSGNPDLLMDLGADDLIRYPLNVGELVSSVRRGARRLEFERRFSLNATFDQQRGVATRRGFTLQLERRLEENREESSGALVVLGIDFLETIRECHGSAAVENSCSLATEMVFSGLSTHDCRGVLEEGVFAVLLHGQSVSDAILFANEVNEQFAAVLGKGFRMSLSGVVAAWPPSGTSESIIQRALSALARARAWGGNRVLDINEVEREYTAWNLRLAGNQSTDARHAMEALPLVLPLHPTIPAYGMGIASFTSGPLPPCIPVVDDVGHLVGFVDGETIQKEGKEIFRALDEHLEPVPTNLRGDSRFEDIVASLESADREYLLVVENKKPIGYVTNETVASLRPKISGDSGEHQFAADCSLNSLVIPLI